MQPAYINFFDFSEYFYVLDVSINVYYLGNLVLVNMALPSSAKW